MKPPQVLVDLIDRPPTPEARLSPDQKWLLLLVQPSLPSIAEIAQPELRLGGLRFNPINHGSTDRRPYSGLALVRVADGETRAIDGLPEDARLDAVSFSPDSSHLAFTHTRADRIELWAADVASGRARRLSDAPLNLSTWIHPQWLADSRSLVANLVPEGRGPAPMAADVPDGPVVLDNAGAEAPSRTYQDLLEDAHDEALFEYHFSSQLARLTLDGKIEPLGDPGLVIYYEPSGDGSHLLVMTLHRPFSYQVPAWRFPRRVEVWDNHGKLIRQIADLPLRESVPITLDSVPTGPRQVGWRQDAAATLVWTEALDGGDASRDADYRDRLYLWSAPFTGEPRPWIELKHRFAGILWSSDELALVSERWRKTRTESLLRLRPGTPEAPGELVFERSSENRYDDPGDPVTTTNDSGRSVLQTGGDGRTIYFIGSGASPEGDRPFLDAFDLESKEKRRLFRSQAPYYERPIALVEGGGLFMLSRRESVEEPPNYFLRALEGPAEPRRLTAFPDPAPELAGYSKELIHYQRSDGVPLTALLYLPPGHDVARDGPLPMLMWAYPQEFKSAAAAGQVRDSPYRFERILWYSPVLWLSQGYAVLDKAAMPIVGEGDTEPNDTFVDQLIMNARAAVDECLRRGVTTAGRIAVGGHSYGAFMTANLLAHSDLFAAGIALSGAYNRTLTPFGFQFEDRTLWQAPELYASISPFMYADQLNEPILLVHGAADNSTGTYTLQSERFYDALKGNGATARLVILPNEAHGYRARESILHLLWEIGQWLEVHVRKSGEARSPIP